MEIKKLLRQAKKPALVICATIFILFFIGFIVDLLCNKWHCNIEYTNSVSLIEIINIAVTVSVTIWLGWYVTKKLAEQRFIKEFLIADIYKIEESLTALERLTLAGKLEVETVFQNLHFLRAKIDILQKTTEIAEIETSEISNLLALHIQIHAKTTNADGNEIDIASQKTEISELCKKFVLSLREIVCYINRHS